jgi:hypothetical protein
VPLKRCSEERIDFGGRLFHSLRPDEAMKEQQPTIGAATGATPRPAIERLLRRSLLMLTRPTATVQDRLDFAELADAVEAAAVAAVARDTAMLHRGFGTAQAIVANPQGSIERAVVELRALMSIGSDPGVSPMDALDAAPACAALARIFAAPLDDNTETELAGLLAAWRGLAKAAPVNVGAEVGADIDELLATFATAELQSFLSRNHALAFAPYGSARLLHGAARLGMGGLGPYLSCVSNIVRGSEDVLGLIALAAGEQAQAEIERWVVLLAPGLPESVAVALVDDLADLGMIAAVRGLLNVAARMQDQVGLMRHLRDAALDLGDDPLALSAQQEVVARVPYDPIEWRCMGAMLVTVRDEPGAAAALSYALKLAPGDEQTIASLDALRAGDFGPFAVHGGFMTPPARKRIRFARRAA